MWSRRCSEERKEEKEKIKRCAHIFAKRQTHMQQNFVLEFVETLFFTFLPLYLFIVLLGFWRVGHYRGWHSKKEGNTTPPFLRAAWHTQDGLTKYFAYFRLSLPLIVKGKKQVKEKYPLHHFATHPLPHL